MSDLNELADQIATDCAEMRNRPKPGATYRVELSENERENILSGLERLAGEHIDYVRENLDEHPDLSYTYHEAAHDCRALADKLREAKPVVRVKGVSIGTVHVGIDFSDPAPAPIPGTLKAPLSPEELKNLNEDPREKQLNKVREIVERLDELHAFQIDKRGLGTAIEGPDGWIFLTDFLDELTEALNADRG